MASASKRNRIMNRAHILRAIWRTPRISRIQAAALLGLDKSTVSLVVNELLDQGLLVEVAQGEASRQGGRKPVLLQINPNFGAVLGMELQPGFFRAALCDLHGQVLKNWTVERCRRKESFSEYLLEIIESLLADTGEYRPQIMGVGVAMGGLVNSIKNVIAGSIPLNLESYDFQHEISDRCEIPVIAENDANACAWGELAFHRTTGMHDFLYVFVQMRSDDQALLDYGGIGVGIGVVINGTLYPGANFTTGEFRSAFWDHQGSGQFSLTNQEAAQVTEDPALRERFFRELARNVAVIVNVMNLDNLFVGGDVLKYQQELDPILHEEIQRNWPYDTPVQCQISFSSFGENAVVYGAAGMILDRIFSDQIFPLGDIRNRHGRAEVLSKFTEAILGLGER
ncbi:Sugar kinase of the NBD/HSP70 family, may contain an N-terminal HTH domain [Alkalispirochaeta americana]|uniref:Sugar kinase of the NBD/HSP70 family, may contain an N-terminal HTH domain n=1 Tax=Alkalispirochaeta americana TaxID=159291 RepID=A0A1N6VUM5_9SPIO|nr:ROK family transcriptional regulator [Alkalispirochaeta americana]SIQ81346.1 Sugar kinase of the NBD/HSP70 family, may contain an N-terminal HTH domain [Alkalispirochaeta americana]